MVEWGDAELAHTAMKSGADNYVHKPWGEQKMLATLRSAMDLSKSRQLIEMLRERQRNLHLDELKEYQLVYGRSTVMSEVMKTVDKATRTHANVMLIGEKGTGKEMLARVIHLLSDRIDSSFIKVDLESLGEPSFEKEFFGHFNGAYSDDPMYKKGCFELASGGTMYIDEVHKIPESLQVKFVKVLKDKKVIQLRSNLPKSIDARIIAATDKSSEKMFHDEAFNKDLLKRLTTFSINLPPLRRRLEDLPLLVNFYLKKLGRKYGRQMGITAGALKKLAKHHWPGNISELHYTLEKAVLLAEHNTLSERDFLLKSRLIPAEGVAMVDLKQNEKEIIKEAILLTGGNLSQASRHLGITRRTLYNKISKYEI